MKLGPRQSIACASQGKDELADEFIQWSVVLISATNGSVLMVIADAVRLGFEPMFVGGVQLCQSIQQPGIGGDFHALGRAEPGECFG